MFDFLNPAMREAKKRAKEEYKQRILQGKINAVMENARAKADRELSKRPWRFPSPNEVLRISAMIIVGLMILAALGSR
jgi:hypothetical protein